ncbi:MAG TPA: fumarylacetoacetate hydrolase family protein, partial [Conexibacter sp.]|nr:fumarylacetoacetate hydrolase family protein [Conexibacter sp.]
AICRITVKEAEHGERVLPGHAYIAPGGFHLSLARSGANYMAHLDEVGLPAPDYPTLFAKYSCALIGPNDDIVLPPNSDAVDWEVELALVIGAPLRHASEDEVLDAVAGYTILNDVTMRDWQLRTSQFLQGKTFEAATPVGPFLVTPEEVDHGRSLAIECAVDGEVMQSAKTSDMLFSIPHVLSYISQFITLLPGDLVATGTPAGVGAARKPPVYLTAGKTLTSTVEGLGEQVNRCVAPDGVPAAAAASVGGAS